METSNTNLIQQAEIALQNNDYKTAENLYFQAYENALLNVDFANVFFCLQKILEISPNQFKTEIVDCYASAFSLFSTENDENEYLLKLQNALKNQANNNLNLQFVLAKIFVSRAMATNDLSAEYQKLLQAKNIIKSLNFVEAKYQKALIELYLSQNTKNLPPPPPLTNYKNLNQSSINKDFSTRNHKNFSNFSKKAKQLWEKNQVEISKNFPYLALFAEERKEFENIKITAFFTNGRAGSHFVHSLLDGYPKIATIPSYSLRYFFDPQMLNHLFPENIFSDINWKENLLQKFFQAFAMIFDGDTKCDHIKGFGKFIGFCEMGENGDEVLRVNKNAFKEFLLNELKDRTKISASAFFILVHYAYEFALGRLGRLKQSQKFKQQKSVIFYNVHIFDTKYLQNFCFAFPNAKYLTITREPLSMLEALSKMYMNATDPKTSGTALANRAKPYDIFANGGKNLFITWQKIPQSFYSPKLFFELFLAFGFTKSATIRLEDIKDHPLP